MNPDTLKNHFDSLLKLYANYSLREFRFKEGKTETIREEAKRLCLIYRDQCAQYVREHPEVYTYLFGPAGTSLGFDENTFFTWGNFGSSLGSALSRMQEELEG